MRKSFIVFCLLFSLNGISQDFGYQKGQVTFSPGIGLGSYNYGYNWGFTIPLVANLDIGFHDFMSFGAYGAYWTQSWDYSTNYSAYNGRYNLSSIHFGGRFSVHVWQLICELIGESRWSENLDVYGTPWIGFNIRSANWIGSSTRPNNFSWDNRIQFGAQLGVRYYPKPRLGLFAEWGGTPTAYSNWGLTFKLKR